MGLVSGKSSRERGGVVRIKLVSCRMQVAAPQLLPIMGYLVARYLPGDADLLCSSIGSGSGPPCPSTF